MVQVHLKKGKQSLGRGRKGISTKIHLGLSPLGVHAACLSAGQDTDMKIFPKLWKGGDWENINYIIADKGYDTARVRQLIRAAGKKPVIPRRKNAIIPGLPDALKPYYKTRSAIERFFGAIKENKRLTMRFDKLDTTFFSFFALACLKVLKLLF